jgi:Plant transposon protein
MNEDDLDRLTREYTHLGFPGCIGCVDCALWQWVSCPISWQGQCRGKEKRTTVRMEVITDDYLRIYWCNFGTPGARNDIRICYHSDLFNRKRVGTWPPSCPDMDIAGFPLTWFYFLSDDIYPSLQFFVSSISTPRTAVEKQFCAQQGARKAVCRVFGVLFKRFHVLSRPSRLWYVEGMAAIVKACVILHNMRVEERRMTYTGSRAVRLQVETSDFVDPTEGVKLVSPPDSGTAECEFWRAHLDGIEDPQQHLALKIALARHIWSSTGQEGLCQPDA